MNLVHRTINRVLGIALFGTLLATSADAQLGRDSEWTSPQGDIRIYVGNSSHYPATNWRTGNGPRRDAGPQAFVEMQGQYQNLRWQGQYWVMGAEDSHRPNGGRCVGTRPNGYVVGDDAYEYGEFDVTFNAAENSFNGQRRWICRDPEGRTRRGAWEPYTGTRKGYAVATPATARAPTATVDTTPTPPPAGTGGAPPVPSDDCPAMERLVVLADGQRYRKTPRYAIRPCKLDALEGDKFQVDLTDPEGKRPTRVYARAFRITGALSVHRSTRELTIPARFSGYTVSASLPFVGEPRAGSAIFNRTMPGAFCNSAFWLAWLDFSDGSRSDPIAVLMSECGARLHPEEVPAGSPGSEIIRVKELKPAKP